MIEESGKKEEDLKMKCRYAVYTARMRDMSYVITISLLFRSKAKSRGSWLQLVIYVICLVVALFFHRGIPEQWNDHVLITFLTIQLPYWSIFYKQTYPSAVYLTCTLLDTLLRANLLGQVGYKELPCEVDISTTPAIHFLDCCLCMVLLSDFSWLIGTNFWKQTTWWSDQGAKRSWGTLTTLITSGPT